jgi:hypothetical protein
MHGDDSHDTRKGASTVKHEQASRVIDVLSKNKIPARMLTYGNPKTWDGFQVDSMAGMFSSVEHLIERLRSSIRNFEKALSDIEEMQNQEREHSL